MQIAECCLLLCLAENGALYLSVVRNTIQHIWLCYLRDVAMVDLRSAARIVLLLRRPMGCYTLEWDYANCWINHVIEDLPHENRIGFDLLIGQSLTSPSPDRGLSFEPPPLPHPDHTVICHFLSRGANVALGYLVEKPSDT